MPSSYKIIAFCLCLLISTLVIHVEAIKNHGNSELATLIAAGLITLLLKQGASPSARNNYALARHANLPLALGPGLSLANIGQARAMEALGLAPTLQLTPSFGGFRYSFGAIDSNFPFGGMEFASGFEGHPGHFGLHPSLAQMQHNKHGRDNSNSNSNNYDPVNEIFREVHGNDPPVQNNGHHNGHHNGHQNGHHNGPRQHSEPPYNSESPEFMSFDSDSKPSHPPSQARHHKH